MTTRCKPKPQQIHPIIRKVSGEIRLAKQVHVLKCGCLIKPGMYYARLAAIVNDSFVAEKHHVSGKCLELLH